MRNRDLLLLQDVAAAFPSIATATEPRATVWARRSLGDQSAPTHTLRDLFDWPLGTMNALTHLSIRGRKQWQSGGSIDACELECMRRLCTTSTGVLGGQLGQTSVELVDRSCEQQVSAAAEARTATAMQLTLYHGSDGANATSILANGPDGVNEASVLANGFNHPAQGRIGPDAYSTTK
jgi:hypothetical protein